MALGVYMISMGLMASRTAARTSSTAAANDTANSVVTSGALLHPMQLAPSISIANGVANLVHGFGTFWNHACRCMPGSHLDVSAMLTITVFPVVYTIFFDRYTRTMARYGTANVVTLRNRVRKVALQCLMGWSLFFVLMLYLRVKLIMHTAQQVEIMMAVCILGKSVQSL